MVKKKKKHIIYTHKLWNALQDNKCPQELKYDMQLYFSKVNLDYYDWLVLLDKQPLECLYLVAVSGSFECAAQARPQLLTHGFQ